MLVEVDVIKVVTEFGPAETRVLAHGMVEDTQAEVVFWLQYTVDWARRVGRKMMETWEEVQVEVEWAHVVTLMPPCEECPACSEEAGCFYHRYLFSDAEYQPLLHMEGETYKSWESAT